MYDNHSSHLCPVVGMNFLVLGNRVPPTLDMMTSFHPFYFLFHYFFIAIIPLNPFDLSSQTKSQVSVASVPLPTIKANCCCEREVSKNARPIFSLMISFDFFNELFLHQPHHCCYIVPRIESGEAAAVHCC